MASTPPESDRAPRRLPAWIETPGARRRATVAGMLLLALIVGALAWWTIAHHEPGPDVTAPLGGAAG